MIASHKNNGDDKWYDDYNDNYEDYDYSDYYDHITGLAAFRIKMESNVKC